MTKQEFIKEMVGVMAASNNPFVDVPIEIMPKAAEALYNAGCRKIDDDRAVITKDELKRHQKQAVKEFAEKLKECAQTNLDHFTGFKKVILTEQIDELLKEYYK